MAITVKTKTSDVGAADHFIPHLVSVTAAIIFVLSVRLTYGIDLSPGLF